MLRRIVDAAGYGLDLAHSILLIVFLVLTGMALAAWLGGGWAGMIGAALVCAVCGVAISKRVFLARPAPAPEPRAAPLHLPGIQDEFERILARQRILGFLLVAAVLALAAVRFALEFDWPTVAGIRREQLLAGAVAAAAVVLPLCFLNWRCPNCRRNLGRSLSIRQCPRCGAVLRPGGNSLPPPTG